ncbi:glycosyltransferase family 59 protein [Calocera viscosa TUFC12733]|uniref:Dol-P-Glc:Glc(2)Man(9)GlcNAc(2)-PP-Dol alpha-1,2-glucosyltransferase n=1 Tax=Calocera viscosa (strain TUFC12733) TaxID=1330018 RepID=A0A167KSP5_CALVF|nr:glycosyltransferase family 59 protein [Calocera viscosa TUFC12733]
MPRPPGRAVACPPSTTILLARLQHVRPQAHHPPGLYLLSLLLSKLFAMKCTLPLLRFHYTLLSLLLPPLLSHLLPLLKPPPRDEPPRTVMATLSPGWETMVLGAMPVAWFVGFLYYTDLGAVVCALRAVVAARRGKSGWAALLRAVVCTFRQTNIIWLVYAASLQAFEAIHRPAPSQRGTSTAGTVHLVDPALAIADVPMLLRSLQSLMLTALSRLPELLVALWPYHGPAAGFALGDRANHVPMPHLLFPYFTVLATALMAPVLLAGRLGVVQLAKVLRTVLLGAMRFFTIAHPSVLSDNRHYTFYIWQRVISPHPLAPYLYAPCTSPASGCGACGSGTSPSCPSSLHPPDPRADAAVGTEVLHRTLPATPEPAGEQRPWGSGRGCVVRANKCGYDVCIPGEAI